LFLRDLKIAPVFGGYMCISAESGYKIVEGDRSQGKIAQGYQVTSTLFKGIRVEFIHLLICDSTPILQVLKCVTGYHIKENARNRKESRL
jgi:hypothetical protein